MHTDMKYFKDLKGKTPITEGGTNGHLAHIFEDGSLTFSQMYDIFAKVFSGKVELREKIDGFAFTVTMRDGVLYSSRNKSELKSPLNFEQTIQKFSNRPPVIKNAFITSFSDMNTALQALSPEEQNNIFNNGKNFLSFEIVSPGAKNIVNYGSKAIIVMHGINIYDENWIKTSDDPAKAKLLYDYFEKHNVLNQSTYAIQGPVVLKIKSSMSAADALNELKADLKTLLGPLPANTTLLKYVVTKITPQLKQLAVGAGIGDVINDTVVADLVSRSGNPLGLQKVSAADVVAHVTELADSTTDKGQIKSFIKNISAAIGPIIDEASMPIWMLVVKAGTLLIKCLDGFIAADQSEGAKELTRQLDDIINTDAKQQLTPANLVRFSKALDRLDKFNREVFGTEGVVFTYHNKIYKLTSTFGPLNQLLGLFSRLTPRDDAPTQADESILAESDDDTQLAGKMPVVATNVNKDLAYVVFIPGSFKPPHLGHINMIQAYAKKQFGLGTTVQVIVSDPKKAKRKLIDGQEITAEAAKAALTFVLDKLGLTNVQIAIASNPPKYIMDTIMDNADAYKRKGVIIGMSSKDGSSKYDSIISSMLTYMYDNNINQGANDRTVFVDPSASMIAPVTDGNTNINATDLRSVLSNVISNNMSDDQIVQQLKPFLPSMLSSQDILTYFKYLQLK